MREIIRKLDIFATTAVSDDFFDFLGVEWSMCKSITYADLVVFTGGPDVDPSLYEEEEHFQTTSSIARDNRESSIYKAALKLKKPMLGICRGAQLGCVLNGGKLIQHVTGHELTHKMETMFREVWVTSSHHQMMMPYDLPLADYSVLAWSSNLSDNYAKNNNESYAFMSRRSEPEIVYFPNTDFLAIQGHPEYMMDDPIFEDTIEDIRVLISETILSKLESYKKLSTLTIGPSGFNEDIFKTEEQIAEDNFEKDYYGDAYGYLMGQVNSQPKVTKKKVLPLIAAPVKKPLTTNTGSVDITKLREFQSK